MVAALLAAQKDGTLRLTPAEWDTVVKQGEGIERDISFREAQRARASKAKAESEVAFFEDKVADFYNNPANAAVSFSQLLQVEDENGNSMAELINQSANTAELMKKAKDAYKTVNSIYDISEVQAQNNNLAITDAIDNGTIKNSSDFMRWRQSAQEDGLQLNDDNVKHAYAELEKLNDPEQPYGTQVYKDFKKTIENRLINAMTPDSGDLFTSFDGSYQGTMADDIRTRFQTNLDEHLAAIPPNKRTDPKLIKAAIADAENDVMEFYKQYDSKLYEKQFKSFNDAVNEGTISWTANPNFAAESKRLQDEQQALVLEQKAIIEANRPEEAATNPAIETGNAILFGNEDVIETPVAPTEQVVPKGMSELRYMNYLRNQNITLSDADMKASYVKYKADEVLLTEAGQALTQLNDLNLADVSYDEFNLALEDIQNRFNLTVPTNDEELKFLKEDIIAMQEETGITLSVPVLDNLLDAAWRRFKLK